MCSLLRSFEVEVKTPKGKVYSLVISDLLEPILPEDSFVKVSMSSLGPIWPLVCVCAAEEWKCDCFTEEDHLHKLVLSDSHREETERCPRVS